MKKYCALCLIIVLWASPATFAQSDANGGYAGAFFQVPLGARPTAMGGAYHAISNDGAAALYNPAGLASLTRTMVSSSYRAMQLDRTLGYVTVMFPVRGQTTIGGTWLHAGSGKVDEYDSDGYKTGNEVSFSHNQFSIVFAKRFEDWISAGVNMNYLFSTFPEISAAQVGFDFGGIIFVDQLISREKRDLMPVQDIRIGGVVKHINKNYTWNSEGYNLKYTTIQNGYEQTDDVPIEGVLAVSARFFQRKLLAAVDLSKNTKQDFVLHVGAEYFVVPQFALRSGYYQSRFTAGTGYSIKINEKTLLGVDYAFSTDRVDEGSEHIFSFNLLF